MERLNGFGGVTTEAITRAAELYGTPCYLYDEALLIERCRAALSMPNAYGLRVRYAMKANSNRSLLRIIAGQGLGIDASSLNEARRATMAGIAPGRIALTTQEVPEGEDREDLHALMLRGMVYNVCSLRQLQLVGDFAREQGIPLSVRVHPGVGSGESATRNTGDAYSCFGIHLSDLPAAVEYAADRGIRLRQVHVHIGSGADPVTWRENIDRELDILERYFPEADTVSFGGGLREARMPDETAADIRELGLYAKERLEAFHSRTGRKLMMEIEPGTYIAAGCGYVITRVADKKRTGEDGLHFVIADGGMDVNTRPLMYGSRHPFYVVSSDGRLLSSEFGGIGGDYEAALVGSCCESGDSQTLDEQGVNTPRRMAEPRVGDYVVIGGAGAYCSSMSPFNYNSHTQSPEALLGTDGELRLIRKRQTLEQVLENEL